MGGLTTVGNVAQLAVSCGWLAADDVGSLDSRRALLIALCLNLTV